LPAASGVPAATPAPPPCPAPSAVRSPRCIARFAMRKDSPLVACSIAALILVVAGAGTGSVRPRGARLPSSRTSLRPWPRPQPATGPPR
jgi:hypothetical protein